MKDEATNEFDPIKFDAEFARVFDERIAAQTPGRAGSTDRTLNEVARLTGQLHVRHEENDRLRRENDLLRADLADADKKIGILILCALLACLALIVVGISLAAY
jgi:hypothetical protein